MTSSVVVLLLGLATPFAFAQTAPPGDRAAQNDLRAVINTTTNSPSGGSSASEDSSLGTTEQRIIGASAAIFVVLAMSIVAILYYRRQQRGENHGDKSLVHEGHGQLPPDIEAIVNSPLSYPTPGDGNENQQRSGNVLAMVPSINQPDGGPMIEISDQSNVITINDDNDAEETPDTTTTRTRGLVRFATVDEWD